MSWKVKNIIIKNFKFFYEEFSLDVNSRNLLIYGENGSGKSSIYWAIYTLFQSRLKSSVAEVEKYFDNTNGENLRNKFSAAGDDSKVEITFEDKSDPTAADITYTIALGNVTTQRVPDTFLDFSVASSDFLNYKILSKLTDKDNSVINDVTEVFIKDIYPFADFQIDYTDLNGNASGIRNAKRWHDYIYSSLNQLEHQRGKRRAHFDSSGPKYILFKRLIREFREQLKLYLDEISIRATTKLQDEFRIKDVELHLETDPEYVFDKPTSPRYRDHTLHPLHIRLNAKYKNSQLVGGESEIIHLRTFFNEAKLTCIGLAIRLAMVDYRFAGGGNYVSLLCFDDLLVSLDMSYRMPVIKVLLSYASHYQLCVFTHDRTLYNMMRNAIKELGFRPEVWKRLEFYRPNPESEATERPVLTCVDPKEVKELIQAYFAQGDYPAAGNCLRRYAEGLIKDILPLNLTYGIKSGSIQGLMLRGLYEKTKATNNNDFCSLYDIDPSIMPNISQYLDRLMNPLSHDNKDVPLFRQELEDALAEVLKYEPIKAGKKVIVSRDEAARRLFRIEMNNVGIHMSVDFVTTEQWDYISFPAPTGKKYKNCEVMIKASSVGAYAIDSKMRIKGLYNDMCNRVFHGIVGAPDFDQVIKDIATSSLLRVL